MSNRIWLAVFVALQVADVLTTQRVLAHGGWEGNPLIALALTHLGSAWWLPKLALMLACALVMARWRPRYVALFTVLVALVVANNAFWGFVS